MFPCEDTLLIEDAFVGDVTRDALYSICFYPSLRLASSTFPCLGIEGADLMDLQ